MVFVYILGPVPLPDCLRKMIDKVKPMVAQEMFTSPLILEELYGRNVIVTRHKEELSSIHMDSQKNLKLLEIIQRRSDEAFQTLLDVLIQSKETTAADILQTGETHVNKIKFCAVYKCFAVLQKN